MYTFFVELNCIYIYKYMYIYIYKYICIYIYSIGQNVCNQIMII